MRHSLGDEVRLKHIMDAIDEIEELTQGLDEGSFMNDKRTKFSSAFQLQIIGEAANNISKTVKKKYRQIQWQQIVGLRNIIAHQYFGIDYTRIWEVISKDLPVLKREVEKIV
ncbi:MAG: DUF86 domain-containing protein [Chitinophagaceae bacterium]|nr:DUF86 domain-containing protein [Chitinophagaceae bacterium]